MSEGGYQQSAICRGQRVGSKSEVKRSSYRDVLWSHHDNATDVTVPTSLENDLRPCTVCVILFVYGSGSQPQVATQIRVAGKSVVGSRNSFMDKSIIMGKKIKICIYIQIGFDK